jgi:hypothetical protein
MVQRRLHYMERSVDCPLGVIECDGVGGSARGERLPVEAWEIVKRGRLLHLSSSQLHVQTAHSTAEQVHRIVNPLYSRKLPSHLDTWTTVPRLGDWTNP